MNPLQTKALESFLDDWTISSLLLKVTNLCCFKCSYCFWFRDAKVLKKPATLSLDLEEILLNRLEEHIRSHKLERFQVTLHGGEPLLFGYNRLAALLQKFRDLAERLNCKIPISLQTNGYLLDERFADLFLTYKVSIGISLDGPAETHNRNRKGMNGEDTFERVVKGVRLLQRKNVPFGVLGVCNPQADPVPIMKFFADEMGLDCYDIMIPDITHDDPKEEISEFYIRAFDYWSEHQAEKGVEFRFLKTIIGSLFGLPSRSEAIGFGPMSVITMETDGVLTSTDTLRICGEESVVSDLNIRTTRLDDIKKDNMVRWIIGESMTLNPSCVSCKFNMACGGGYLPHRFSRKTGNFQQKSVYCEDLYKILSHIADCLEADVVCEDQEVPLPDEGESNPQDAVA
ncbi:MAG: radical SAM protein [Candidatus Riflebacteria bacterium]|nr:radical SAM protein [Candidatus Riflebacteria bacterium]